MHTSTYEDACVHKLWFQPGCKGGLISLQLEGRKPLRTKPIANLLEVAVPISEPIHVRASSHPVTLEPLFPLRTYSLSVIFKSLILLLC